MRVCSRVDGEQRLAAEGALYQALYQADCLEGSSLQSAAVVCVSVTGNAEARRDMP